MPRCRAGVVTEPVNEPVNASPPLTVLYDGACPLCRREIGIYRGLRPNTPVYFANVSDAALPVPPGTTRAQLLARFHVRGQKQSRPASCIPSEATASESKVEQ